ncbi:MAG: XTP/dITP diphosphatase [Negativicutes bacterium]|nr:XTP/dITP diphosphatase [Negativicutes bacterium]
MRTVVVATRNKGKVAEIAVALAHLSLNVVSLANFADMPEPVEDGQTFRDNAVIKAKYYARHTGLACLADDSGLEVDALGGEPGVYSARYAGENADDAANNRKLLAKLAGVPVDQRTGRFRCVLAYIDETGEIITAEGSCEGVILAEPRGEGGFGYDPLFYLPELGKTLAEISVAEKNKISHRGQALRNFVTKLEERGL